MDIFRGESKSFECGWKVFVPLKTYLLCSGNLLEGSSDFFVFSRFT